MRMEAPDVRFVFPGTSSWAADIRGKDQVQAWLTRMIATGLQHEADEIMVSGPPWRMTMALRGRDWIDEPGGTRVYENRYVIWGRTRWGRVYDYEVYEDTEQAVRLDAYLGQAAAAS
jgi:ketosteroid isomerase-like protein